MYSTLLLLHNLIRWVVVLGLLISIFIHINGITRKRSYNKVDALFRLIGRESSNLQFILGSILYFGYSPIIQSFFERGLKVPHTTLFFGIYHISMMFIAIVLITIGSAKSRKASSDLAKFKYIVIYFSAAFSVILLAIPWFRPYFRF